jgi:LysM repeat protein
MKSMLIGLGMVVAGASLGLVACADDTASPAASVIEVGATNYITIPPTPATIPPITTAPDTPGSKLEFESEYTTEEGDLPSTVSAKFHVVFQEFLDLNGWTLEGEGASAYVPDWPPAGTKIKIPAGATVPGEPVQTIAPEGTGDGSVTTDPPNATPTQTDPPASVTTTTTSDCTPGSYTIVADDYPGKVALKFDVTVAALDAANVSTKYYKSFAVGIKIVIPC